MDSVEPRQGVVKKTYTKLTIILALLAAVFSFLSAAAQGLSCAFPNSNDPLVCVLQPKIGIFFVIFSLVFVLCYCFYLISSKSSSGKVALLIYLLVACLAATLYILTGYSSPIIRAIKGSELECRILGDYKSNSCYETLANSKNDVTFCSKATHDREGCFALFAIKSGNIETCPKDYSHDECITNTAVKLRDFLLCDNIEHPYNKGRCYARMAAELQDPNLCSKAGVGFQYCDSVRK